LTAKCAYCDRTTTSRVVDSHGVHVPVCVACKAVDPTPPPHDPTYQPGWRVVRKGAKGPHWTREAGIDIPAIACALGISRQAVHKRLVNARAKGPEALEKVLLVLRNQQSLRAE